MAPIFEPKSYSSVWRRGVDQSPTSIAGQVHRLQAHPQEAERLQQERSHIPGIPNASTRQSVRNLLLGNRQQTNSKIRFSTSQITHGETADSVSSPSIKSLTQFSLQQVTYCFEARPFHIRPVFLPFKAKQEGKSPEFCGAYGRPGNPL